MQYVIFCTHCNSVTYMIDSARRFLSMYLLYHRDAGFVSNCLDHSEEGDDIELMRVQGKRN